MEFSIYLEKKIGKLNFLSTKSEVQGLKKLKV